MGVAKYKENALIKNQETYYYYYKKLRSKGISMFEWINLPKEIDERYLEMMLFDIGYVCFFNCNILDEKSFDNTKTVTKDGQYFALQCTLGGRFNVYNLPTDYRIYTPSGFHAHRTKNNSVIIYNNYLHEPSVSVTSFNAKRITNIERTIDVNLNQLKRPFIFLVPENQRLTFEQLINNILENRDVVVGNNNLDINNTSTLNTITPNNTLELYTLKRRYYGEALGDLGIDYNSQDKKERMLVDEVNSNNEDVFITRANMLLARKQACKQINEMFGLDVDVRYRYEPEYEKEFTNDSEVIEVENE